MYFAIIENNKVINTILADQDFVDKVYPGAINITDLEPRPAVNWTYNGSTFEAPVEQ